MIFWFLVAFSVALLAGDVARRCRKRIRRRRACRCAPKPLLRDYVAIFLNPRFQRLAAAGTFNFGALFLYIASAPAFVLDLLQARRAPVRLVLRADDRRHDARRVRVRARRRAHQRRDAWSRIGFACCGVAAALNIAYNLLVDVPTVPWAVLPMMLNAFGIALVFPILTLAILDMYPRQRGSASSLQAFTGLVSNALIAGVLSPLLSQHALHLALGAAVFSLLGWVFWRWEMHVNSRMRMCAAVEVGGLEPTERL